MKTETSGPLWAIGWLGTVGLLSLKGWTILWALFIWPVYLGRFLAGIWSL